VQGLHWEINRESEAVSVLGNTFATWRTHVHLVETLVDLPEQASVQKFSFFVMGSGIQP
jgi:hypothetical protein